MASDLIGFDGFMLRGCNPGRATAVPRLARNQVQRALRKTMGWRMEAALPEIDDEISARLGRIRDAADAEASGNGLASQQAWLPLRAA